METATRMQKINNAVGSESAENMKREEAKAKFHAYLRDNMIEDVFALVAANVHAARLAVSNPQIASIKLRGPNRMLGVEAVVSHIEVARRVQRIPEVSVIPIFGPNSSKTIGEHARRIWNLPKVQLRKHYL